MNRSIAASNIAKDGSVGCAVGRSGGPPDTRVAIDGEPTSKDANAIAATRELPYIAQRELAWDFKANSLPAARSTSIWI
jgi:hypothetical protein